MQASVQDLNRRVSRIRRLSLIVGSLMLGGLPVAMAQNVSPSQRAAAQQAASSGVPLGELAANAPESYTVKAGDTLWGISGLFLKSPWLWPQLWGMNMQEIRNPHRIFPGQQLVLVREGDRATLRARGAGAGAGAIPTETVKVSPRVRYESLAESSIPTIKPHLIEPFLAEPLVIDEAAFNSAPRIVATQEGRVLLSRGDRAYASSQDRTELVVAKDRPRDFRIFRNLIPLKDPASGEVLGFEAQFVGRATLVRGESQRDVKDKEGKASIEVVPATIDIVGAKEEMRVGDRLIPEPQRELNTYVPRAPASAVTGQIVSVYGSAVTFAAQNQVVVINRGARDGMERGHVMAILKDGEVVTDKTDPKKADLKLPDERNGLLMVFRTFDRLSYALVLQITDGVKVGDRVTNPR